MNAIIKTLEDMALSPLNMREKIADLERAIEHHDNAKYKIEELGGCTNHHFADGQYCREMYLPAGRLITGKIHKNSHPTFLMSGEIMVASETQGLMKLKGPCSFITPPGTKRVGYTLTDVLWVDVFRTDETDPEKIEEQETVPSYEAFAVYLESKGA